MSGMDHPCCPYKKGSTLVVEIEENGLPRHAQKLSTLHLEIIKLFEPVTVAPVALVRVKETAQQLVAKFYDRRFNPGFRAPSYNNMPSWDGYREKAFRDFISDGEASKFISQMYEENFDNVFRWSIAQEETLSHSGSRHSFQSEIETYHALEWMQGQNVPKLMATFSYQMYNHESALASEFFRVQGLMMEYIPGFLLSNLTEEVESQDWQNVVNDAISVVRSAGDLGVLNTDIDHRHFIVRNDSSRLVPVMFDFGETQTRKDFDSFEEWLRIKCGYNEEERLAFAMQDLISSKGGTLKYTRKWIWGWEDDNGWHCPKGLFDWRRPPAMQVV